MRFFKLATIVSSFAVSTPMWAGNLMTIDILKCNETTSFGKCGSSLTPTSTLKEGSIQITTSGELTIFLKGALPKTTYTIFVGAWDNAGNWQQNYPGDYFACTNMALGTITTNTTGFFNGRITTAKNTPFVFPSNTTLTHPNFAFNDPSCNTQFSTGIVIK